MAENIEGPVTPERQVPRGTRIQIDVPVKAFLLTNGALFLFSGFNIYSTLKALHNLNQEPGQPIA